MLGSRRPASLLLRGVVGKISGIMHPSVKPALSHRRHMYDSCSTIDFEPHLMLSLGG